MGTKLPNRRAAQTKFIPFFLVPSVSLWQIFLLFSHFFLCQRRPRSHNSGVMDYSEWKEPIMRNGKIGVAMQLVVPL